MSNPISEEVFNHAISHDKNDFKFLKDDEDFYDDNGTALICKVCRETILNYY